MPHAGYSARPALVFRDGGKRTFGLAPSRKVGVHLVFADRLLVIAGPCWIIANFNANMMSMRP
jgi:hypothetical protein